ncbi:hypothetical protein EJK51_0590 [Moraxella catarrhalis]|uniref:Uncharacterized protein n=1 Tax=Moraxella catarrhalis TaxID=480 RepID=A0A3S9QEV8_MORCA|nr:hypothetical protein EJK52_0592 [Moraxella catarrhalis]AZQ91816.1 hypothetical protein EJK51_0590 [Moraxella catarrhalis]AZQ93279.1 hypothetical protein EJK53_0592 [Moraxella catarrhalis]AZQ95166.1 hypothetical protein EJK48_0595 [Moraxella catarrhalis]
MTYYLVCYLVWVMTLQKQNLKKAIHRFINFWFFDIFSYLH